MTDIQGVVERHARREFLIAPERGLALTFREFYDAACALAGELEGRGLTRGERVLAVLPNSAEYAVLYLACLLLGVTVVPVSPALHARDVGFILRGAGAKLLIFAPGTRSLLDEAPGELARWRLPALETLAGGGWRPRGDVTPDDWLAIVHTSGTTASPKAVPHRIGSLVGNARAFNERVELGPEHRFLHLFPMAYSGGFFNQLLSPLLAGASVVMTPGWGPRTALDFWRVPRARGVNALWLNPAMAAALLRVDRDDAGRAWCRENIRRCFIGTAPLPVALKRDFEAAYGVPLYESYGLSETLLVAASGPRTGAREGSVGGPLEGVELRIAEDGEVLIRTPHLTAGAPAGWFASGDLGRLSADGALSITGRKKDMILRAGFNVSPAAVEDVLLGHEAVEEAAVVGVPSALTGEEIVAVVRLKPGFDARRARASLEAFCRAGFAPASRPLAVLVSDEFPTGPTGKVLKRELRAWAAARLASR